MTEPAAPPRYLLISPGRNEAEHMERTLESVMAQTVPPALWVVVDDGSTDDSPAILERWRARHPDVIRVLRRPDRGRRAVGPGVIEAFYDGLASVDWRSFPYLCKLDLDLILPPRYFEILLGRMEAEPRIGTCSGKPYARIGDGLVSEKHSDEMSSGAMKLYRRACFEAVGGFVRATMWDAIDCHTARMQGWIARSWDEPDLVVEHLRPEGSSQTSIHEGRRRHGRGQWYMGSDPAYFFATCAYRMSRPPRVTGGLAMAQGYLQARREGAPQHPDADLRAFVRAYQRRALRRGRAAAVAAIEAERAPLFARTGGRPETPRTIPLEAPAD